MTMQYVPAPLSCFSCGQVDAVRKVSSLVSQGVTTGTSHGTAVTGTAYSGGGSSLGVTGVNMSSVHMTGQAQMLMPPAAPRPLMKWTWWIVGGVVLGLIAGSILSSATANLSYSLSSIGWLIGFGATLGLFIYLGSQQAKKLKPQETTNATAWNAAMYRWNQLFHCARCDNVFDPQDPRRVFAPVGAKHSYLYRQV